MKTETSPKMPVQRDQGDDRPAGALPFITAEEVRLQIGTDRARHLIEDALLAGFDPSADPSRSNVTAGQGHLLLMPSTLNDWVGVKVASVTPGNPAEGLPRIQAVYLLMDAATLTPRLLVEGSVLTALRTPAVTAVACDHLAAADAERLVVFGSGPQAVEHVAAISRIRQLTDIRIVGRSPERTQRAVAELQTRGVAVQQGTQHDVAEADIVVCATSAGEPLFDGSLVRDGACVAAMGSHETDRRELEGELVGRSLSVVEDVETAMREAGDIVLAVEEGHLQVSSLHSLHQLVTGRIKRTEDRPNLFKVTGMSWQDLAVASGLKAPT